MLDRFSTAWLTELRIVLWFHPHVNAEGLRRILAVLAIWLIVTRCRYRIQNIVEKDPCLRFGIMDSQMPLRTFYSRTIQRRGPLCQPAGQ